MANSSCGSNSPQRHEFHRIVNVAHPVLSVQRVSTGDVKTIVDASGSGSDHRLMRFMTTSALADEESDQDDDRNWNANEPKENRAHDAFLSVG